MDRHVPVVDAHLDLAYNVQNGRELTLAAADVRRTEARDTQSCMVTIPELRRGGVALAFGSVFVSPKEFPETVDIEFDPDRWTAAKEQAEIYLGWEDAGLVRIVRSRASLDQHMQAWVSDGTPGILVAMESAEPIRAPDELGWWFDHGVRMIGPAWGPTRYCGGFAGSRGQAVGLTSLGRELVEGMRELGIALDLAHGSVELFWEGLESDIEHVALTHTVPRELIGLDRLPDAQMLGALARRGGVVGLGMGNVFLSKDWWGEGDRSAVDLATAADVVGMIAGSAGWEHVGIGSDLDGGIGVEESPVELDTIADLRRLGDALPDEAREPVLGGNWLRFLSRALPEHE